MKKQKILWVLLLAFSLLSVLSAQERSSGSIRGVITDAEGNALPGATVTVSGEAIMGTRTAVTNQNGAYRIPLIPIGTCTLVAKLPGFQTVRRGGIAVRLSATVTINVNLAIATIEEEMVVEAPSPPVDVKASTQKLTIGNEHFTNLPIGRSMEAILELTPGTVFFGYVKGGTRSDNTYQVDGINVNNPCHKQNTINIDFNIMEEIEVVTAGAPAEVGITTGGFMNVITKKGGNKYSGNLQFYYINEDMTHATYPEENLTALGLGTPASAVYDWDLSASMGGPIIKDKLWFYVNGRYGRQQYNTDFIPFTDPWGVYYPEYTQDNKDQGAFLKLSGQLSPKLRWSLMGNLHQERNNTLASGWNVCETCMYRMDPLGKYAVTGSLTWLIDQNTFVEIRGGWLEEYLNLPLASEAISDLPEAYDYYTGYYLGTAWRPHELDDRTGWQASAHLTRFMDNVLGGDHEIKMGVEVQQGRDIWSIWKNNPLWIPYWNGSPKYNSEVFGHNVWGDNDLGVKVFAQTEPEGRNDGLNRRFGYYLQDSWTIANRLTVNLGLRYDHNRGWIPEIFKGETGLFTVELGELYIEPIYGINPYAENTQDGFDPVMVWNIFSPRLGLTYDVFGDGKTALKIHVGRYGDDMHISKFHGLNPFEFKIIYFRWWDTNNNNEIDGPTDGDDWELLPTWGDPIAGFKSENMLTKVGAGIKPPRDDQIVVGIDHELFPNFKVGMSYMYKHKTNMVDDVLFDLDTGEPWYNAETSPGDQYWVPFTTTVPAVGDDWEEAEVTMYFQSNTTPTNWLLQTANVPEAYRKYSGLEITWEKRMADGWQLGGSITFSKLWGNMHGDWGAIHARNWVANNANWNVNGDGRLAEDRPLVIKLFGTFDIPYGIMLSFNFNYYSGWAYGRQVTIYPPAAWAAANNVANLAYNVRVEPWGSRRSYPNQYLDLRLEKQFDLFKFGKLAFYVDIWNLLANSHVNVEDRADGQWFPADNNSDQGSWVMNGWYGQITGISGLMRTLQFSVRFSF